ncbi:MAG: hypothetical protein JWL66_1554 [Sphingomonadales bacterium]|jgi:cytochrome P450|nr:hypothetical protein [Sphingomonadales bacterium]
MNNPAPLNGIPSHIPADMVRPFILNSRTTVYQNPFETIIPELHRGVDAFYGSNAMAGYSAWVFRRAVDMRELFSDMENFKKKGNTGFSTMIGDDWSLVPSELDAPMHMQFRKVLNPFFSPAKIGQLESKVRTRAKSYVDAFKDRGSCDFVKEMAVPYPVSIFLDLLGLPAEEMAQFLAWEQDLCHSPDMDDRIRSTRAVKAYLLAQIEDRRKNPGDDLISNALQLEVGGRKWTSDEVFGHCFNLYIGGLDTVSSNMGWHFYHLATHPEHQLWLRQNPGKGAQAIEEMLRAYGAVTNSRICAKEIQIGDVRMLPGDRAVMCTPLASRDPDSCENPNEIRFDRRATHLTFGWGDHRCLGAHLARRELLIATEEMLSAIPEFAIEPGFEVPFFLGSILHIPELRLKWKI